MLQGQSWEALHSTLHGGTLLHCVVRRSGVHSLNPEMGYKIVQGQSRDELQSISHGGALPCD